MFSTIIANALTNHSTQEGNTMMTEAKEDLIMNPTPRCACMQGNRMKVFLQTTY